MAQSPRDVLQNLLDRVYADPNVSIVDRVTEGFDDFGLYLDKPTKIKSTELIYEDTALFFVADTLALMLRGNDDKWRLHFMIHSCNVCFGPSSAPCPCCCSTGWEGYPDFIFSKFPDKPAILYVAAEPDFDPVRESAEYKNYTQAARATMLRLMENYPKTHAENEAFLQKFAHNLHPDFDISDFDSMPQNAFDDISYALVFGDLAQVMVRDKSEGDFYYFAILRRNAEGRWQLQSFTPQCPDCKRWGYDENGFCAACGGTGWGKAGELHFCKVIRVSADSLESSR